MKKTVYMLWALLVFALGSVPINAQSSENKAGEDGQKVLKINVVITKHGETKTINKEVVIPDGVDVEEILKHVETLDEQNAFNENVRVKVCTMDSKEAQVRGNRSFDYDRTYEKRAFLGVVGYTTNAATDKPKQVRLTKVVEDGPAAKAGLQSEDILKTFDGKEVSTYKELIEQIKTKEPGERVEVVVSRNDKDIRYDVVLGEHDMPMHARKMMRHMRVNGEDVNIQIELEVDEVSAEEVDMIQKSLGLNNTAESQFEKVEIDMFPNPTSDIFKYNLKLNEGGKLDVFVINQDGKQVYSEKAKSNDGTYKGEISLKNQAAGIYYLVFKRGDKLITEKVIRQ